jgi:PAS domain S-box-containing protein
MNPRGAIVRHFLVLFVPITAMLGVAALVVANAWIGSEVDRLTEAEQMRVTIGAAELVARLRVPQEHLLALPNERVVRNAIDEPSPDSLNALSDAFGVALSRNPQYDKIRWIDETGQERVRVDRNGEGGGSSIIRNSNVSDRSDRAYFVDGMKLGMGEIGISQLDLALSDGKPEVPYKPSLRFMIGVADSAGHRRGILMINYLAAPMLLDFVRETGWGDRHVMLLDQAGYWLSSPDVEDEWGFMFGRDVTLRSRDPEAWNRIRESGSGHSLVADSLWTWKSVSPLMTVDRWTAGAVQPEWFVVSHPSSDVIRSIRSKVWGPIVPIVILFELILGTMSWQIALRSKLGRDAVEARVRSEAEAEEVRRRLVELEASERSSATLKAIIDSTQDAIFGKDLDGLITSWNPSAERMFGYRAEEAIGRSIHMLLSPGQEPEELEILKRIGHGEGIQHFEPQRRHKDGHLIDVSMTISPVRDASGTVVGASNIARDITQIKRAEAELLKYREHLEELVEERTAQIALTTDQLRERDKFITIVTDNIPGMVAYWDRDLICRFANRWHDAWYGVNAAAMIGLTMPMVLGKYVFEERRPFVEAALRGERSQFFMTIRRSSGDIGHGSANYIPDWRGDEVVGFIVLVSDVTALKITEVDLRDTNEKLNGALTLAQDASKAKSQFLANMSHEIRTPLNGVLGMLEILGHTSLDGEQVRMIDTVRGSARTLLRIIDDILDFSKIEAGHLETESIAAEPTEIVESTSRLFLGAAAAKGLKLRCFVAPSLHGQFLTDPVRLRQILSNLISNAVKFTSTGVITTTADLIRTDDAATSLRIVVADSGIGISREAQRSLFQPFSQADDSIARRYGGTGLGLSICHRLATLLGGKIELVSVEGRGTQVTLDVPTRPVEKQVDSFSVDLQGVRVGLMASDPEERSYFSAYLSHWGAEVVVLPVDSARPDGPPIPSVAVILAPDTARTDPAFAAVMGVGPPRRFVAYSYDDPPADGTPAGDTITTTALSRNRIVTAVAVAAGRKSPEVPIVDLMPGSGIARTAIPRDQAIREGTLILLAEDNPVNRDVTLRQLGLLGYQADAVEDGIAALVALSRVPYGLLLTDCSMPEMSGFELTKHIRQCETGGSHLPIIALTANAMDGEAEKCFAAGMDDYLTKPVEMAVLRARLARWLPVGASEPMAEQPPDSGPPDPEAPPSLNMAVISEFCGGDSVAIDRTVKLFLDTMRSDRAKLCAAIAEKNAEDTRQFAHRMKGAANVLGVSRLATHCGALESAAIAHDWPAIDRDLPRLVDVTVILEKTIDKATMS